MILPGLTNYIADLITEFDLIPPARKATLERLSGYINTEMEQGNPIQLNFICTHNSRRSQIGQIWMATIAHHFQLNNIHTFSGGTETTAFNIRAVEALKRLGFVINGDSQENPHYQVQFATDGPTLECFSKTYDDPSSPTKDFAAIMVCDHADANCPFIPGAAFRLSLPYEDPKVADDTPEEQAKYEERIRQIGRELLYVGSQIQV